MRHFIAPRWQRLARFAAALQLCALLSLTSPDVSAQFPAVWVGGSGAWLAKKPGDWTIIDFNNPWQFFPDNNGTSYFFATIPSGHVYLNVDIIPGDNGVPISFLGVEVSTLALGNDAELTLQNQATLAIQGISQIGGLLHNDGLVRLTGTSALSLPFVMPITGSGEIVMASEDSFISGVVGVLTHSSSHTISGFGQITVATMFNQGRVLADTPGKALKFTGGHLDNSGLLRAGARVAGSGELGGELRLKPLISMKNSGEVVAENGFVKIEDSTLANSGLIEARTLGTVSLQDLDIDNAGGLLRVRSGGAMALNGSNKIKSGLLEAEPGSMIWVASGVTELRSPIGLTGLLKAEGGSLLFRDADISMPQGRIELAAGVNATTGGISNTFRGGTWQGSGRLSITTGSFWDGVTSAITLDGPQIDLFNNTHRIAGNIVNNGRLALRNTTGFNQELRLILEANTDLTGNGELLFAESNGGPKTISAASAAFRLRNAPQHRILGSSGNSGAITADLLNEGLLDSAGATFQLWSANITNTGILRSSGGQLQLTRGAGTAIANAGGRIESAPGGSVLFATNAISIAGGTLAGGGEFRNGGHLWLDGASSGALTFEAGTTLNSQNAFLHLAGSFVNDGTLELRDGTNWTSGAGVWWIHGPVTFNGSGKLLFAQGNENVIDKAGSDALLTIGNDQTLSMSANASGTVKVDLNNQGRVEARGVNSSLLAPVSSIRNTGVIGAFDGASFNIGLGNANTLIDNQGGRIEVGAGSVLSLGAGTGTTTILGGTLGGAGRIDGNNSALDSVNIEAGVTVRANAGSNLYLRGTIVNDGTLELYDGTYWTSGAGVWWVQGPVTFNGSGKLLIAQRNENLIDKVGSDALLTIGSGQTLTMAPDTSATVKVDLNNQGRVEARGLNSSLFAPVSSLRNTGVIGAFDGASFNIGLGNADTLIDNRGGRIEVGAGSVLSLGGSHPSVTGTTSILGGTIAGAGLVEGYRYAALDGVTIEAGATVRANAGTNLYLRGTLVNDGTLELRDNTWWTSGAGVLWVQGPVTVNGSGRLLIAERDENVIDKAGSDALLTIGSGQTLTTAVGSSGRVRANLANENRIEARGAGSSLALQVTAISNHGTLAAAEGADLRIGPGNANTVIDNRQGRIDAGAASRVFLADAGHPSNFGITTVQGGILTGSGTFFMQLARLSDGVRIAPGQSPGLLSFNGELQLDPLGALEIEIGGTTAGISYDRVNVSGRTVLDGTLDLSLWAGFMPGANDVFIILSAQSLVGSFDNVVGGRVDFAGGSFELLTSGGELRLRNFVAAVVPEPDAGWLMLAGLLAVGFATRRRA